MLHTTTSPSLLHPQQQLAVFLIEARRLYLINIELHWTELNVHEGRRGGREPDEDEQSNERRGRIRNRWK